MSIATQISRLQSDRNTIRNKLIELGLATGTANLDVLAAAIEDIVNVGAVSIAVKEGETYTIPKGYHPGTGTVSGVAGGGNYTLQSKTVTPTKKTQAISPDSGYYGLSDVSVAPIPDAYQDVSSVTATENDTLTGKIIVLPDGRVVTGTMPENGTVSKTLDVTTISYTIPKGHHSGDGTVTIVLETKTVTPTKEAQEITPSSGKVLSKVTVAPIPAEYITTDDADAEDADILISKTAYVGGVKKTGTMPDNGTVTRTLDIENSEYAIPAGKHSGSGKVSISPETKSVTPTKNSQDVVPSSGKVLSKVTVDPIPDEYQDVTGVTTVAEHVLVGDVFVDEEGNEVDGAMPNNGAVSKVLDATEGNQSYTVPEGYHDGTGAVEIALEEKSATPTKSQQTVIPAAGKVLSSVTVAPIPDAYQDITGTTATDVTVLDGCKFIGADGAEKIGSMPENGDVSTTIDGLTATSVSVPEGHTTGGTISLTSDIEDALALI